MGFQLTIAAGKEAGREFVFDQASVVIGRTSECDVVLYDPGVSRRHARIFAEGAEFFVEDMGSSNGTKVNGAQVKKAKLSDGDAVTLGPVVFNFSATELPEEAPGVEGQSTRIVAVGDVKKQRGKGSALAPQGAPQEQLAAMTRKQTQSMEAVSRPRSSSGSKNPPVRAPAKAPTPEPAALAKAPPRAPVRAGATSAPNRLTAAERARLRREATSLGGKFRLFWAEASPGLRKAVIGGVSLFGLLVLGGIVYALVVENPIDGGPKVPEPDVLTRTPIEQSFGVGPNVSFEAVDQKVFSFEVNSPSQVVVILHFQCSDISQGEVRISVNGSEAAIAPADQLGSNERSHEVIIPPKMIKRGEVNQLAFDNAKNPPAADPWRVWNIWIEVAGVPSGAPEDLLRQAQTAFGRGQKNLDGKDIGAPNRYEAWRDFRTAWLTLEGHPDPKPDLYQYSRDKMKEAQEELDKKCNNLMLEFERYASQYDWPAARSTLEHVKQFFPGNDQPCPWRAEIKREEWGL